EKLRPHTELRSLPMRDFEVLRYREIGVEVAWPGELVAPLLAEAIHGGGEVRAEKAGRRRGWGAPAAGLPSTARGTRGHRDRCNIGEAIVETLQNAERVRVHNRKRQSCAREGRARNYPSAE